MQFDEVIGQREAQEKLLKMVEEQRVPHAMMFTGPSGSGKLALALAFASYLLGERTNGKSILRSDAAIINAEAMLRKWQHPDLHFSFPVIKPTGSSADRKVTSSDFFKQWIELLADGPYFSMDQWMNAMKADNQQAKIFEAESDELNHKLHIKSSMGGYKVCVIWLPERMNLECANKMLKLLEEPPLQTVFLLVTEEPSSLLETIRSRVQHFYVKGLDNADIKQALISRRGISDEDANYVARAAAGSWLKALEVLDADNENQLFLEHFVTLMRQAYARDLKSLKRWSEEVSAFGREKKVRMLEYFLYLVRENFMFNFQEQELNYMMRKEEAFAQNFARFINERNVVEIAEMLQRTIRDIKQNANAKMQFFNLAMNMIIYLRR